jgi:hypothetical protein
MDSMTEPSMADLSPIRAEVGALPETARTMAITDEASFTAAGAILVRIKALRALVERLFTPHIKRAFEAHRALLEDRRRLDTPLAQAETILKQRVAVFSLEEEERRALEARRRAADAHETRTARIWAEVIALEAAGYQGEAADLVQEFVKGPPLIVGLTPTPLKAPGISCREVWRYEVTDPEQVPREYLTIDHSKLGGVVRALKTAATIPGVRIWVERTIAAMGR